MNTVGTKETATSNRKAKIASTIKKVLLWTVGIIVTLVILAIAYQILQYLFVGAILLIAWLGPRGPRRWWW